jgi:hypothetical protein
VGVFHRVKVLQQTESETREKIQMGADVDDLTEGGRTGL